MQRNEPERNRPRRWTTGTLAAALAAALLVLPAIASSVGAVVDHGHLAFEGKAQLDDFPCDPDTDRNGNGTADGKCEGSFSANVTGALTGHHEGADYAVSFNTVDAGGIGFATAMTGTFTYEEDCNAFNPNGIVQGEADGSGAIEIPSNAVEGRYRPPQTGLGHDVDGVEMTFTFEWDRRGNDVAIELRDVAVRLEIEPANGETFHETVVSDGSYVAGATFAPVPHGGGHAPTCDDPISVDGVFAGDLDFASRVLTPFV